MPAPSPLSAVSQTLATTQSWESLPPFVSLLLLLPAATVAAATPSATPLKARADALVLAKDYAAAVDAYTALLAASPPSPSLILSSRALAYVHLSEFALAERDALQALAQNPRLVQAYLTLATAYARQDCLVDAFQAIRRGLAMAPSDAALLKRQAQLSQTILAAHSSAQAKIAQLGEEEPSSLRALILLEHGSLSTAPRAAAALVNSFADLFLVAPSSVHGHGAFATRALKRGATLFRFELAQLCAASLCEAPALLEVAHALLSLLGCFNDGCKPDLEAIVAGAEPLPLLELYEAQSQQASNCKLQFAMVSDQVMFLPSKQGQLLPASFALEATKDIAARDELLFTYSAPAWLGMTHLAQPHPSLAKALRMCVDAAASDADRLRGAWDEAFYLDQRAQST